VCGIAGAVRAIRPPAEAGERPRCARLARTVAAIAEAQRHRGPDGAATWESPGQEVVFGHRRLAVLDLTPAGAQPMVDPATGCAITFNGEIYNFRPLRAELQALGETFSSSCDTEVILKAWSRWGPGALGRLRGIFAFALWDPRTRAVHLARDPLGVKPLYWTVVRDPGGGEEIVLFASEVRALLAAGAVPARVDAAGVASYLWQGFVVGPRTIVDGVNLLPAATVLTIDGSPRGNRRAAATYWSLPAAGARATSPDDLRAEVARSVEMQLEADVPLGVFLSGGVDSSAVGALAARARPGQIHTFTVGFDVPGYDESGHARRVAGALGTRHSASVLTEETFCRQLDDAFAAVDQPTFDGLNTYFVSRAAREAGMTVALAGTGGDELFGGYPSFSRVPALLGAGARLGLGGGGILGRAVAGGVAMGARAAHRLAWDVLGIAPPQARWGKAADLARASGDALGLYQVGYALFTRDTQAALAAHAVRSAQNAQDHGLPGEVAEEWRRRIASCEARQAVSALELASFAGERLLRDTDTASMAVGLEVRVPLLDHVLAETAAGIDPGRRFSPCGRKQALRDAALGGLDPGLFDRPKSGFVLPIDAWARRRLRGEMDDVFADDGLARRAGLRGEAVRTVWRSFTRGRPGLYWSRPWSLFVLMKWCRAHDASIGA